MRSARGLLTRSWTCVQCRAHSTSAGTSRKLKNNVPDAPARTRFAPSPTGYLHLGSLRTALFNYLLAKRTGGQFLLRIEDTDQKRTIPDAEQRLYDDLRWAGLHRDEGPVVGGPYGPYRQSERKALYHTHVNELIANGHAYRCFCSSERLDAHARHRSQAGLPPGYDRKCADIPVEQSEDLASKGEKYVVRLKVNGYPMFHDLVYGKTGQNKPNANKMDFIDRVYDDPILLKSDGHPTGSPPQFGHVPLLVDKSGQKLSKRNMDIDLSSFKDQQGIFAETLTNFAALLGWSHAQKSDVFNLEELEKIFNLKITRGNTVVAFEKLWFLQKAHAQRFAASGGPQFDEMVKRVAARVQETYSNEALSPLLKGRSITEYVAPLLRADAKTYTTAEEFLQRNATFFTTGLNRAPYTPATPQSEGPTVPMRALHTAAAALTLVPDAHWNIEMHRSNINSYDGSGAVEVAEGDVSGVKTDKIFKKELYHYLRWALSASAPGPGIPEIMTILGRDETVRRIQEAKELTKDLVPSVGRRVPKTGMGEDRSWMGSLAGGK
ncbi:hypothetical protein N7470_003595 [Penicillium chermesinum]|nr:hypothetical protein N7470_003595 [Penicillium chermesinum]